MALTSSQEQGPQYPVVVATLLISAKAAVIGSTTLLASAPPGIYRANVSLIVTTVGSSGNLVANLIATDDVQAETIPAATIAALSSQGQANGSIIIENTASANINYSTTASGTFGSCQYSLYIVLERLF